MVSVDPGVKGCGIAAWNNGTLTKAKYIQTIFSGEHCRIEGLLVIEKPQIYRHSKGDPNDLISLAIVIGRLSECFDSTVYYLPREWKGQVPKDIHHKRIRTQLTPGELAAVKLPKNKKHALDVWDAIGIGLYHLRKTGVRR